MIKEVVFNYKKQIIKVSLLAFLFMEGISIAVLAAYTPVFYTHRTGIAIISILNLISAFVVSLLSVKIWERRQFRDYSPAIDFIISPQKDLLYINRSALEFFGIYGSSMKNAGRVIREWVEHYASGPAESAREKIEYEKSGRTILFTKTIDPGRGNIFFFGADITDQKTGEKEIQLLISAVEQSANTVIITDPEGRITYLNRAFEKISGYDRHNIIGKNPNIMNSGYHPEGFYTDLWQTIKSGEVWQGTFLNRRSNGDLYWEEATISPIFDGNREIISFIAVKEDITGRMKLEQDLRLAKTEAEKANLLKSDFLKKMSHEIRTPLNGILGLTEILVNGEGIPDKETEMLGLIRKAGKKLLELVNDIIEFSRMESSEITAETPTLASSVVFGRLEELNGEDPEPEPDTLRHSENEVIRFSYDTSMLEEEQLRRLSAELDILKKQALEENIDGVLSTAVNIAGISDEEAIQKMAADLRKIWEHIDDAALTEFLLDTRQLCITKSRKD